MVRPAGARRASTVVLTPSVVVGSMREAGGHSFRLTPQAAGQSQNLSAGTREVKEKPRSESAPERVVQPLHSRGILDGAFICASFASLSLAILTHYL